MISSSATDEVTPLSDAESVLNSLRRVVLALRVWSQEAEGVLGLSGAQLFVLQRLADRPEQSVNELAGRTLTSKSSVSVVVARLVHRGLVRRRRSPLDGRSVMLSLTAAGRRIAENGPESPQARILAALARMPETELSGFAGLFDRFVAELGLTSMEPRMLFEDTAPRRKP